MSMYPIDESGAFEVARSGFEKLVAELKSDDTLTKRHDELERLIHAKGTEVLRGLLQGHLELRALREECSPVEGADGVLRTHKRAASRPLEVLFGDVTVYRRAWSMREFGSLHPLDAELNLPTSSYSFELQRQVCQLALGNSFDRTVDLIASSPGGRVPKRQAEQIVVKATQDFDAFYASTAVVDDNPDDLLVLSFDQKGVVMRLDSLRPATRKAALESKPKLGTRLSKGEKPNRKRMAMVATVYSLSAVPRTAEDLLPGEDSQDRKRAERPRPTGKRVWASIVHDPETVVEHAFREALDRDPDRQRTWVVLVDGNRSQIRLVRKMARRHGVEVTLVLDIVHVIEYLWKAAWAFHDEGDPNAEAWVHKRLAAILEGRSSGVAAGMRRSATRRGLEPQKRKPVDAAANYLVGHRDMLRYDLFLPKGLPVATGVIEGACRHLIGDRLDITGARWGLEGAEAVLRLRALHASGDFDAYWDFHTHKELERNHLDHYADPSRVTPQLRLAA